MPKIKLLTCISGFDVFHKPGEVIDVSDAEAARHLVNGNGALVDETPTATDSDDEPETAATDGAPETADATPRPKKKRNA